jgi:flagellar motility protein MotE (MotC chaperone)
MSGKMKIVMVSGAALASFGAMMAVSMLGNKPPPHRAADANSLHAASAALADGAAPEAGRFTPKERQLEELIRQVQGKIIECRQKEDALTEREGRLTLTQEMLKKQTKDLDNEMVRLLARQSSLAQEQEKLDKSRVRIAQEEKVNLKHTASIYEKMDSTSGGRILVGMCESRQIDDAVKILHYMGERPAAKILAEVPDKALAAQLTEMLKRIREEG